MMTLEELHKLVRENCYTPPKQKTKKFDHTKYREEESALRRKFKQHCFEALDIIGNPKADLLFEKAWELGHSAGHHEVLYHMEELVDLIR